MYWKLQRYQTRQHFNDSHRRDKGTSLTIHVLLGQLSALYIQYVFLSLKQINIISQFHCLIIYRIDFFRVL